jgi:serine/threonine-protein kinase HipA
MAKRAPLGVWLYGQQVAELTSNRPGDVTCRYSEAALDTWPGSTPLLSCSLPLGSRPLKAGLYFRGMLPEGQHLQAMASVAKVPTYDTFGLLARFGRDVAGAAVIAPTDPGERPGEVRPYTPDELADEVGSLEDRPLAIYDDSELSIAGLQNKLLLVATDDGWGRPVGGRPSTHILKLEDRRYPGLVTMEAACLRLARAVGLTTVDASVQQYAGIDCLLVSRFDRATDGDHVTRIHQEDSCQALGIDPDANERKGKYEYRGGPSLRQIAEILDRHAIDALPQLHQLVRVATFTAIIGNADAHGKNVSLLHTQPGRVELAPLYDTVPTALWPKLPDRAAMFINQCTQLADVTLDDVVAEAITWHLDAATAARLATETVEGIRRAVTDRDVPDDLRALVQTRASAFLRNIG